MKYIIATLAIVVGIGIIVLACRPKKVVDRSMQTNAGSIEGYRGNKKLLVAFTASWASVWAATKEELRKIDHAKYDLAVVDVGTDRDAVSKWGIDILPTVALVEDGKIVKKQPNLMDIKQIEAW